MSVKELEERIKSLTPRQLENFTHWFEEYREARPSTQKAEDLTLAQKTEVLRRREAFLADPSIAEPWEGTTQQVLKHLHARRNKKTASRRR